MFWLFISSLGDMASPRIDFLGQFGSRDPHLPYYNVTGSVLTPGTVVFTGAREVSSSEVLRNVAFVSPPLARSWARVQVWTSLYLSLVLKDATLGFIKQC